MAIFTGIASLVAGAIGLAGAAATFFTSIVGAGLSFGAQALFSKYTNRPKKRSYSAFQEEVQIGGDVPISSAFGTVKTGGHELAYFKWGKGNKYNASVIQLADFECDGLEDHVLINEKRYNLISIPTIGGEDEHYEIEGFEDLTSIRFYRGSFNQVADAKLVANSLLGTDGSGTGFFGFQTQAEADAVSTPNWKSTSRCNGKCYLIAEIKDDKIWDDVGYPKFKWALRALKCYDPRKDSTISGGSGSHRVDNPDTWEWTDNNGIIALNFLLGRQAPITGKTLLGVGKSLAEIDIASYINAANACSALRTINGRTISTYECNIIFKSGDDHSEIMKEIVDAMAGYEVDKNGLVSVVAGAPQIPLFEITEDDILSGLPRTWKNEKNADQMFNSLVGQYTSVDEGFKSSALTPVTVNADKISDNGIREVRNDFLQVLDKDRAQYLLWIRYRQNRLSGSCSFGLRAAKYNRLQAGDWVTYAGKSWMCKTKDKEGLVAFVEVSSSTFASEGIVPGPLPYVPIVPINPSLITQLQNFRFDVGEQSDVNGSSNPILYVQWDKPDDPTITNVVVRYNIVGDTEVFETVQSNPESGFHKWRENVLGGLHYEAYLVFNTEPPRFTQPTAKLTTSVPTPTAKVTLAGFREDAKRPWSAIQERIDRLEGAYSEATMSSALNAIEEHRESQKLSAKSDRISASIQNEELVRVSEDEALAASLQAVNADFDGRLAQGLFLMDAVSSANGSEVNIALKGKMTVAEAFEEAGLIINMVRNGLNVDTKLILKSDRLIVTDANDNLVFGTDALGDIVLNAKLKSADGKRVFDIESGSILWAS